ncbi:MAG: flagellar biosynthesis protein FlhB [Leptospirales bacterium]|nr:flagellar biosynthesis protein FlhB [Leptospirales bacterium]
MEEILKKYYTESYLTGDNFRFDLQLFAAEDEGRTEDPTEKKLREAREKGQVAKTQELPQALVVVAGCLVLFLFSSWIWDSITAITKYYFTSFAGKTITVRWLRLEMLKIIFECAKILLPIFIATNIAAIIGEVSQVGFQFSAHPLRFDLSRMRFDPATIMRKIFFSKQVAVNLLKSIAKIIVIGFVAYLIIKSDFDLILRTPDISIGLAVRTVLFTAFKIILCSMALLLILSIPDYFFQKREFIESLKMSKKELKDELKETLGDPNIRAKIREMQRKLVMKNMFREVPKADVVVTNPTHYAVALKYDKDIMDAPAVVAKGEDSIALRIIKIAKDNNVEIIENRPLARELYNRLDVGDIIPEELLQAVVYVYAELYKRQNRYREAI